MRIALLTHQWPSERMGGIGTYVRQCAAALAAAGHDIHVFTLELDLARAEVPAGVTLHTTADVQNRVRSGQISAASAAAVGAGGEGTYRLALAALLCDSFAALHREQPFDIVEAPEVEALALPLLVQPYRTVPVVTHLHCCTAIAHATNHTANADPSRRLTCDMEFAAIHLADGRCAPTRAVVAATAAHRRLAIDSVDVVPHPFESSVAASPPPPRAPAVFVGRIEWLKGCGVLAEALNVVLARHPGARFRFIGPDTPTAPGGKSMRAYIRATLSSAVADRVEFFDQQSPAQVQVHLRDAAFCVQPSLRENFSLACCEAMASARAVIACRNTGSAEVVGEGGILVEPGSPTELAAAMVSLYRDPAQAERLGAVARQRIRDLADPLAVTNQRVSFYQRVIERFHTRGLNSSAAGSVDPSVLAAFSALTQMTASLLGLSDSTALPSPGTLLRNVCRKIAAAMPAQNSGAHILLYGAGKYTARLLAEQSVWERDGHRVVGLIDDHPRFAHVPSHLGLPIRSLKQVKAAARRGEAVPPVVLSTDTYQEQFWEQTATLRALGVIIAPLHPMPATDAHESRKAA